MDGSRAVVRGEKVWLRAFEEADLDAYWTAVSDADVSHWAGYVSPPSRAGIRSWYENRVCKEHGKEAFYFVISPIGSDEYVGTIWLWNFDSRIGGPELSIYLSDPGRWGQGLGTDAVNALVDFAFGSLDVHRIWLFTSAKNPRSARSFAKAGFVEEGTIRQNQRRRGEMIDSILMSMLRSEWSDLDRPRGWDH